jgi:hypothetical protein
MRMDRRECRAWPGSACSRRTGYLYVALAIAVVLCGCASVGDSSADRRSYVGVFTGDFVDGLPLYRLPSITVVGRRAAVAAD